ncbi:M20/M25/M40 family metallo-hydrolase [Evansella sp. AB-rgal1]|uniref:M20/M25/M40 family metallo-hydrolase n=1 Tax=Evansella sp. AB-rgal1 TaxID=3242696 RepID=UPI00359CC912
MSDGMLENKEVYISPEVAVVYKQLLQTSIVKEGLVWLKEQNEQTLQDQIELTEIPAPTFQEEMRGKEFKRRLEELGLENIEKDQVGNVFGLYRGTGNGPRIVVSAHLDTVFPEKTDVKVRRDGNKVYAPGIADDGRGLAVVLTLLKLFNNFNIETEGDILFGATVGEEGLGDLNGVKALFKNRDDIDGFISIEPGSPTRATYLATGSHRYRVTFRGKGGHSFGDFGTPSAIHALGRAVARISDLQTPDEPKTTFTVGTISGGTSVNTIAEEATMLVDIRSTDPEELQKLEIRILEEIHTAVAEENKRWDTNSIKVELEQVGNRPAGTQSAHSMIVQAATSATKSLGYEPKLAPSSSTDSNVPISLGIPAVTLGGGGMFGGAHTLSEYFDATNSFYGPQQVFLTILGLVGIKNGSDPVLPKRK